MAVSTLLVIALAVTLVILVMIELWKIQLSVELEGRQRETMTWLEQLISWKAAEIACGVLLLSGAVGFYFYLTKEFSSAFVLAVCGASLMGIDLWLLCWRSRRGLYGGNRFEAEELLTLMARRRDDGGSPPRRVQDHVEELDKTSVRPGAPAGGLVSR